MCVENSDTMEIIVWVLLCVAGIAVGYVIGSNRCKSRFEAETKESASVIRRLETEITVADERLKSEQTKFERILADREKNEKRTSILQERHHREAMDALQNRFDETVAKMQEQLKTATAELLKARQQEFEQTSRDSMAHILEPLNRQLGQMREAVTENTRVHGELGGRMSADISNLLRCSESARESADRLANALRNGGKIQGDWGETVLTELLESQGLSEGVHFDTQSFIRDASGNIVREDGMAAMRPDVILHLDKERDVVIDAKVSLSAYLDYMNAESDETRNRSLRAHVESIRKHVAELAAKDYSSHIRPPKRSVGYVIMFVPNSAALLTATNAASDLWRKAMERNVYIADEQTLYAALKIIAMTWQQIAQAENHEKVYALANEMLDRVGKFMQPFVEIGSRLESAHKAYDNAMKKLAEGGQSIPQTCNKLIKLGARQQVRKGVPDNLLGLDNSIEINDSSLEFTET